MSSSAPFDCTAQSDLRLQICSETKLMSHRLQFVVLGLLHLDFHLVAHAEFVFYVLGAAHASEDSTSHHDTKLGGQGFSFLHRVSREDNS